MKRILLAAAAVASITAFAAPAGAQAWRSINQRQAQLDHRIDRGVRNGALTRGEAIRLRAEFRRIAQLENYYRRTGGGLDGRERRDLDRRMDILAAKIRMEKRDYQRRY